MRTDGYSSTYLVYKYKRLIEEAACSSSIGRRGVEHRMGCRDPNILKKVLKSSRSGKTTIDPHKDRRNEQNKPCNGKIKRFYIGQHT